MDYLTPYLGAAKAVAGLILLGLLAWGAYEVHDSIWDSGYAKARAEAEKTIAEFAKAEAAAQGKARAAEQRHAKALADVAEQYEQDKLNAQAAADRLTADLRAGTVRLHDRWQACRATDRLAEAVASASEPDAAAEDRAASAGRIVRAAADADAQIRGLQEVIRQDRK